MTDRVLVLGGTYEQAFKYVQSTHELGRAHILSTTNQMLGLERGIEVHLVGTWYARDDWEDWDRAMTICASKRRYPQNDEGF